MQPFKNYSSVSMLREIVQPSPFLSV